jgi:hypothetical protein
LFEKIINQQRSFRAVARAEFNQIKLAAACAERLVNLFRLREKISNSDSVR